MRDPGPSHLGRTQLVKAWVIEAALPINRWQGAQLCYRLLAFAGKLLADLLQRPLAVLPRTDPPLWIDAGQRQLGVQ